MATVTRTDGDVSTADTNSYSFTATIGTNSGSDSLYFCLGSRTVANGNVSGVTVDGVAATNVKSRQQVEAGNISCVAGIFAIARNDLPTPANTTVTVVVNFTAGMIRCALDTYVSTNAPITAFATAEAGSSQAGGSLSVDVNVNTPQAGMVIAAGYNGNEAGGWNWTGLTENSDIVVEAGNSFSTATAAGVDAATPRAISGTLVTASGPVLVAASFAPTPLSVDLDVGSFVLTGQDVDAQESGEVDLELGALTVTGHDLLFVRSYMLQAEVGVYTLASIPVTIPGEEPDFSIELDTGQFVFGFHGISHPEGTEFEDEDQALTRRPLE